RFTGCDQIVSLIFLLTKRSFPPIPGWPLLAKYNDRLSGCKNGAVSSPGVLIVGPRLRGNCQSPFSNLATQISRPPYPPGRLLTKYSSLLSGDKQGIPSNPGVFMVAPNS